MPRLINLTQDELDPRYNLEDYDARSYTGEKLGKIDSIIADSDSMRIRYLVIDGGGLFSSKDYVVPVGEVERLDDEHKGVYLHTLTKDTLTSGTYPRYDEAWWDRNDGEAFGEYEMALIVVYTPADGSTQQDRRPDYSGSLYQRPEHGADRLGQLEEHLRDERRRYIADERQTDRVIEYGQTVASDSPEVASGESDQQAERREWRASGGEGIGSDYGANPTGGPVPPRTDTAPTRGRS